ncbi:hypothetical protein [Nocardia otitidiscaviarum]|uniref:hypothetical protein n=1 Tax=Nocardia otitidiscaviarum TaxID=1823 RepID=UPI002455E685|nr:hypothetical protein [Nocardia otitidiscaviarum]
MTVEALPDPTRQLAPALAIAVGTVVAIIPPAIHLNPPIEDAAAMLRYVAERPSWRWVDLLSIGAVLLWAAAFSTLRVWSGVARTWSLAARTVLTATAAVFAVYYSLRAFGLQVAADRYVGAAEPSAAVLSETESLLMVLGSVAFTAQAMLGISVALYGIAVATTRELPTLLGAMGIVSGAGWFTGALLTDFAVIVPFTVLGWAWTIALATVLAARALRTLPAPGTRR